MQERFGSGVRRCGVFVGATVFVASIIAACGSSSAPGGDIGADAAGDAARDGNQSDTAMSDVGTMDAVPACMRGDGGSACGGDRECVCCPAGGDQETCLCTTRCVSRGDCTDAARPFCNQRQPGTPGICTPEGYQGCEWNSRCAAANTPIATPSGERSISEIEVGDLVYGARRAQLVPVRVLRVSRVKVSHHSMVRVTLEGGRVLEMSAGHPAMGGRRFGELAPGDLLGGTGVVGAETVPYKGEYTYDLLPDSDEGSYVASGTLVGSTLYGDRKPKAACLP